MSGVTTEMELIADLVPALPAAVAEANPVDLLLELAATQPAVVDLGDEVVAGVGEPVLADGLGDGGQPGLHGFATIQADADGELFRSLSHGGLVVLSGCEAA